MSGGNMIQQFFIDAAPADAMAGNYAPWLVVLSYVVAVLGSYTGLSLASEYTKTQVSRLKTAMLVAGAIAMGCAIWSMHFIGMLAYKMEMRMSYDAPLTILSFLIAISIAFGFFKIVASHRLSLRKQAAGALLMGAAVFTMHYTGMAAMQMDFVEVRYLPGMIALSFMIAVTASGAALWIFSRIEKFSQTHRKTSLRAAAALVMGAAICGMHYTGMAAAVFIPNGDMCVTPVGPQGNDGTQAIFVAVMTGVIVSIALSLKFFKLGRAFFSGNSSDISFPIRILTVSLVATGALLLALSYSWHVQNSLIAAMHQTFANLAADGTAVVIAEAMARRTHTMMDRYALVMAIAAPVIVISWITTVLGLRKWRADLMAAKKQSDKANAAKSEFLANMSHDLRTPMNGIIGLSQLLIAGKMLPEQEELIRAIVKSGESLLFLLNDILDFSKMEAGELSLEEAPFNLKDNLKNVINLLSPLASKKGLTLHLQYCEMAMPFVIGDPLRINQIVTNLVGNAIKFTESGHVNILVDAEVSTDPRISNYNITVEDTGIGIDPSIKDKLFNKFEQGDASRSRKFGGTGLGLAITRMLVTKMRGTVGFESVAGKGTTFRVQLPLKTATAKMVVRSGAVGLRALSTDDSFAKFRVLLVDDHPVNRLFANKLLQKMGFRAIEEATNGAEALQKISNCKHCYDIILMDCQMPEMDGFEATRLIRDMEKSSGSRPIPIIAMTAHAMVGDRLECLKAGMDDYISKPVNPESLRTSLCHWLLDAEKRLPDAAAGNVSAPSPVDPVVNPVPIDLAHLELFTEGEPAEEKKMAEMFVTSGVEILNILEHHIAGDRTDSEWKQASHKFKGSALQIGAMTLAEVCLKAESAGGSVKEEKKNILRDIEQQFSEVRRFFAARQQT